MVLESLSLENFNTKQRTNNKNMKVIFFSHMKRPIIVYKPMKVNSDNDVIQEPRRIMFDNHYFQTDEEDLIEFIKKLPNFGADYVLVDEVKHIEEKGPKVGVTQMNTPEQEKDNKIANLEKQISELKDLIMQVASKRPAVSMQGDSEENDKTSVEEDLVKKQRIENLKKAREAKK